MSMAYLDSLVLFQNIASASPALSLVKLHKRDRLLPSFIVVSPSTFSEYSRMQYNNLQSLQ